MLFFRHRNTNDPVIGAFEESTLETLRRRFSGQIWVLPHLYDLPPNFWEEYQDTVQAKAGETPALQIAFSWLPARASQAILRQQIKAAELTCFDLEDIRNSTISLESLPHDAESPAPAEIRRVEKSLSRRWYPVIDYQACQNCLECVNFCLFGVYTIGEGHAPLVEQPDQCRDGCPACSRVCPAGAILFPEYDDPVISGRQKRTETKDDLDRLIDEVG